MNALTIVTTGFLTLEAANVVTLCFFPGSKLANGVGVFKARPYHICTFCGILDRDPATNPPTTSFPPGQAWRKLRPRHLTATSL